MSSLQSSLKYWLCAGSKSQGLKRKGTHLDESDTTSPPRATSDLEDIVLQLSDPQQHVRKSAKTDKMTAGGRASSYSLSSVTSSGHSTHSLTSAECRPDTGSGRARGSYGSSGGSGYASGSGRARGSLGDRDLGTPHANTRDQGLARDLDKCHIRSSTFIPVTSSQRESVTSAVTWESRDSQTSQSSRLGGRQEEEKAPPGDSPKDFPSADDPQDAQPLRSSSAAMDRTWSPSGHPRDRRHSSGDSSLSRTSTVSSVCSSEEEDLQEQEQQQRRPQRYVQKSATTTTLSSHHHVSFDCESSSPDVSEGDEGVKKGKKEKKEKDGKKRRFGKKMLSKSLRRSQSASCAKDVPAHALFLQHQLGDKDVDTLEERLGRTSARTLSSTEVDLNSDRLDSTSSSSKRPPLPLARPIHKTASADAAMMALDGYGNITCQTKTKSSLAKTMKRKLLFLRRRHTDSTLGTIMKGDGKHLAKIHPEDALQWSRSFESLLLNKTGLELFRGFLRSEFSDENLEFWIAVEEFKLVKPSKVSSVAQKIYSDYVVAQAPREINVDSKTRGRTLAKLKMPNKEVFEEAQRKVQALMEKDSYPRFLESDFYQQIIRSQKS